MARRTQHISVTVPEDHLDAAVSHYKALLGVSEQGRLEEGIELKGDNFTLWLEVAAAAPRMLQEFETKSKTAAQAAIQGSLASVSGESDSGIYVSDPFGLNFHFYVEGE